MTRLLGRSQIKRHVPKANGSSAHGQVNKAVLILRDNWTEYLVTI